jgi:histidine kinase
MFSLLIEFYFVFNIPCLIAAIQYKSVLIISIITCLTSVLTFFSAVWLWKKRNFEYISLYHRSANFIKKLNHRITRLKQSSENYKRIISEKEIEILQASRHASLAEVTSGIAHELTQPLTGIRGISQNLIDDIVYGELDAAEAEADLLRICSLIDKSTSIIDHVRNFSKKSGYSMKPIDLNSALLNAIELVKIQLKNLSIDIVFELSDNIPEIMGDNLSLEQLIVNIIQNSRDAILEKKENKTKKSGQIRITTSVENSSILLTIKDNGIGIPDDILHKIWSPFFTSKKRTHGTGIGLSISNKILKAHNAEVDIDTNREGTRFTFIFPALVKEADAVTNSAV